jgi:uncharacterized DUF497 family protein
VYIFKWDQRKSDANFRLRRFDFAFAARIFDGPTIEREDARRRYGEVRIIAFGLVDGIQLTVVYTDRLVGNVRVRRIISARHSSRRERNEYGHSLQNQGDPRPRPG